MNQGVSKRVALWIAAMGSFLTPFMGSSVNIALPSIGKEFGADAVMLNWVATAYLLSAAMLLLPFGKTADIYGRKKIFLYGVGVYTLASGLTAFVPDVYWLVAARIVQGAGSAMMFGTGVAILTSVFPEQERGRALGFNVAAVYLGLSLGPFLGGFLTQHFGWRSIFYVNIPLGIIILLLGIWKLKGEWAEAAGEKFDFTGSVVYGVSLAAMMYGFSRIPQLTGYLLVIAGIAGIAGFVLMENRQRYPLMNISLLSRNRVFALSNVAALINYSATFAVGFLLSLYLQYIKGLTPQSAGIILMVQPVIMTVFSPVAGRLSDRYEPRLVASVGMMMMVIGLTTLDLIHAETTIPSLMISLVLLGFGYALFSSPNTNAVMSSVEKKYYGVASATVGTMRLIGQMLSMGIVLITFSLLIGKVQISPANFPQFIRSARIAFVIFTALCAAGVFASLARGKIR
ncbi:MAG: MFS transporter [Chlorobi bacterium]|nr:MFS transporter [Chlorobiota bacterium]